MTWTDQLREAVRTSGRSLYHIAHTAGVDYTTLHRFMHLKRAGMHLDTAEKVAHALGLELSKLPGFEMSEQAKPGRPRKNPEIPI